MILTKEAILGMQDLATKDVPVPAWGGETVRLRALSASTRLKLEDEQMTSGRIDWSTFKLRIVALSIVNEDGSLMFSEADMVALGDKSPAAIDLLFVEANELNALSNVATDNAEKGSAEAQADGSNGNSPGDSGTHTPT